MVRRRHAAVDRLLQHDLLELVDAEGTGGERGADVHPQLLPAAERDHRADHQDATVAQVEPGPGPDFAPGVAGDQVLELGGERRRRGHRPVDVGLAQDRAPDRHARLRGAGRRPCRSSLPVALPPGQGAVDERAARPGERGGIERAGDPAGVEVVANLRLVGGHLVERAPLGQGPPAAAFHHAPSPRPGRSPAPTRRPALRRGRRRRRRRGWRASGVSSTTRCASAPAMAWAASRARSTSAGRVSHSACQPPTARSCSCDHRRQHRGHQARRLHRRRHRPRRRTGLRLCGIDEEPPRPGAAASATSPTSVCASRAMSRPTLPSAPQVRPSAHATSTTRLRSVCHGRSGTRRSRRARQRRRRGRAPRAEARQRAGGAAELDGQHGVEGQREPLAHPDQAVEPGRGLGAEGRRGGLLQPGAAGDRRGHVAAGKIGRRGRRLIERGQHVADRGAQLQHQRRVDHVLAGGPPVHVSGGGLVEQPPRDGSGAAPAG